MKKKTLKRIPRIAEDYTSGRKVRCVEALRGLEERKQCLEEKVDEDLAKLDEVNDLLGKERSKRSKK